MRIEGGAAQAERGERTGTRFSDALERAGRRNGKGEAEPGRGRVRAPEPRRPAARDPAEPRDEARAALLQAARHEAAPDPSPIPELAAVVRALPPAITSAIAGGNGPLALSFGRSLDVELRPGVGGVEVVLRPEPRLLRAAEAELPRLVEALRVRGVAVASAVVRPRGGAGRAR